MRKYLIACLSLLALFLAACSLHTHTYDEGKTLKAATCTEDGQIEYTCTECNETKVETIPALGHDESDWITVKEATCTEDGKKHKECTRCKLEFENETIKAKGHNILIKFKENEEPTCTSSGKGYYYCSNCDYRTEETTIAALGHNFITKETIEVTCTTPGMKIEACTRCNKEKITETKKGYWT